ncbi:MAG: FG-GAP-like repeat-containing protein [Blastocatellia bacterium]|nr:FG-GAP-like repeat-containing protein [Blastocatellia bacterium]
MMNKHLLSSVCIASLVVAGLAAGALRSSSAQSNASLQQKREPLYRLNNLGVAFMEQYKHEDAVKQFKQALAADPDFAVARINLALAQFFLNDSRAAVDEARAAVKLAPENLSAHYVLAAALRNEKLYDESLAEFNKVLAVDGRDPATNVQIGQLYSQKQQYAPAIEAFRHALDAEPYNATAAYSLAQALIRSGNAPEGQKMLTRFQQLRASGYATTLGNVYGEKGRYAEAVVSTGAEPELVSQEGAAVGFTDVAKEAGLGVATTVVNALGRKLARAEFNDAAKRELAASFGSSVSLGDIDSDNRLDLLVSGIEAGGKPYVRLFRNEGGKFSDVTARSKIAASQPVAGAVFGDFDNDGKTDLALFGYQTLALWKNAGDGAFVEATAQFGLSGGYPAWAAAAAWVDIDHDGDLDLYVGNFADLSRWPTAGDAAVFPDDFPGEENRLFRNNGNGSFAETTAQAGLGGGKLKTAAIVPTDYNNQRDIDLLVVNYGSPAQLFSNQRDGSFREVAASAGLRFAGKALGAGAGDLNKDNFTDFYLPDIAGRETLFLSDGRSGFNAVEAPEGGSWAAQMVDYDNDGLLDVVTQTPGGVRLRRGLGSRLAPPVAAAAKSNAPRALAIGDVNDDGGNDLLAIGETGAFGLHRAEGFGKNFTRLSLAGKTSNRSAIGAKVEMRSGSLRQKLEIYSASPAAAAADAILGLGARTQIDALQLLWPAGILQSEVAIKANENNSVEELDRKGTSCPILYAWDGSRFDFVTDFLGGSAIGARTPGDQWNYPDTDEYVRVTSDQLKERDGRYSILMNNQLEEVIYFDAVNLLAVDHPAATEIYPNERLMPAPPLPAFKLYSTRDARPPRKAADEKGNDLLPLIEKVDRRYPEDFEKLPFKGYAREHAITLDLGDVTRARQVVLLLTAWIDYADSTSNMAATQAGVPLTPPYLQVKNDRGQWQTVIPQMGFPAGLPKTMTVDLTGKFLCRDAQVRIVTNMRIYWDQILVDASDGAAPTKITKLSPMRADLRWRGFPREYSPDGRKPLIYDYSIIEPTAPWKAHLGNYTRFGDVRELLLSADDMYVITRSGDEIQIDFDARRLPALPRGWKRTFLVFADGFGKDMDLNSARPETIGELPFHGMKSYPHAPSDRYPATRRHQEYLRRYNTRNVNEQTQAIK